MGVWDRHHKPQGIWGRGYRVPVNEMGTEPPMWLELRWVRGPPWVTVMGLAALGLWVSACSGPRGVPWPGLGTICLYLVASQARVMSLL